MGKGPQSPFARKIKEKRNNILCLYIEDYIIITYFICYVLLLRVCYTDLFYRKIKNKTVVLILIVSLVSGIIQYGIPSIIFPCVILLVGFLLSSFSLVGAGDVKLLVALSFSLSSEDILRFITTTALCGLLVVIPVIYICIVKRKKTTVPYGIAISMGYFIVTAPVILNFI